MSSACRLTVEVAHDSHQHHSKAGDDGGAVVPFHKTEAAIVSGQTNTSPRGSASSTAKSPPSLCLSPSTVSPSGSTISSQQAAVVGWVASPRLPDGWALRSRSNTYASSDGPATPTSTAGDGFAFRVMPSSPISDFSDSMAPVKSLTYRPKRRPRANRESWDSGIGSDLGGRHTRVHSASSSLDIPDMSLSVSSVQDAEPKSAIASTSDSLLAGLDFPGFALPIRISPTAAPYPTAVVEEALDMAEDGDAAEMIVETKTDRILNYTLDIAFGLNSSEVDLTRCHSVVKNFVSDLSWAITQQDDDEGEAKDAGDSQRTDPPRRTSASAPSASRTSFRSSSRSDNGKRKSRNSGDDERDGDDELDGGGEGEPDSVPPKRARLDAAVRISCPYRKRNPLRFNVRDHRLCALTVFTDTAELRRHIQDWHRRPIQSPHRCLRCQVHFAAEEDLRDHQMFRDGLCTINNSPSTSFNFEDGIDNAIAEKLRCKRGRVSDSIQTQWEKIWDLLFPGTASLPFEYCAVMEHFELYERYRAGLNSLKTTLGNGLGQRGLDTLENILNNHFIELFEECNEEGRRKDYRNRQTKPMTGPSQLRPKQSSLRRKVAEANRDSGVDMGMEDDAASSAQDQPVTVSEKTPAQGNTLAWIQEVTTPPEFSEQASRNFGHLAPAPTALVARLNAVPSHPAVFAMTPITQSDFLDIAQIPPQRVAEDKDHQSSLVTPAPLPPVYMGSELDGQHPNMYGGTWATESWPLGQFGFPEAEGASYGHDPMMPRTWSSHRQ